MGNNAAFTQCEAIVISVYNAGVLDATLLGKILEAFRDSDADEGGKRYLMSQDDLELNEVIIKVLTGELPERWEKKHAEDDPCYWDRVSERAGALTEQFGW